MVKVLKRILFVVLAPLLICLAIQFAASAQDVVGFWWDDAGDYSINGDRTVTFHKFGARDTESGSWSLDGDTITIELEIVTIRAKVNVDMMEGERVTSAGKHIKWKAYRRR